MPAAVFILRARSGPRGIEKFLQPNADVFGSFEARVDLRQRVAMTHADRPAGMAVDSLEGRVVLVIVAEGDSQVALDRELIDQPVDRLALVCALRRDLDIAVAVQDAKRLNIN